MLAHVRDQRTQRGDSDARWLAVRVFPFAHDFAARVGRIDAAAIGSNETELYAPSRHRGDLSTGHREKPSLTGWAATADVQQVPVDGGLRRAGQAGVPFTVT
jgi:hypothetical protein